MGLPNLPARADVVIIGGGIIGCSLAYHLTKRGCNDVLLLERKQLTCGTTWHAAGLVGQLRATRNMTMLAQYTADLLHSLEEETGQATGFKQNGSLSIASNEERFEELKRGASMARTFGLEVNVVTPEEMKALNPLLNADDLVGGVYLPKDGQTNPIDTAMAFAKGARMGGARIVEGCKVTDVITEGGKATAVDTEAGRVEAGLVVNCAGMWGREVAKWAGAIAPLQACEHFYVVTEEIDNLPENMPVLRDPDHWGYFKEDAGKLLIGAFEPVAKPWALDGIPEDFSFDELPEDMEHFMPVLEAAMERVPLLQTAGLRTFFNGPESFTPDDRYLLGPSPDVENFYLACGFNSIGIQSSGGAGRVLADWIVDSHPPMDLWDVDNRRVFGFQNTRAFLKDRATESLGLLYQMHWPFRQYDTARNARHTPLHDRMKEHNACFGETAGWERPHWFAPEGVTPEYEYSWKRQNWFDYSAVEHKAVRKGVALFDQSAFAKFLVQGKDALPLLQKISTANIDVPVGRSAYTQWLNERGGIEADLTIARKSEHEFLVITGAAVARRDYHWLTSHLDPDSHCFITDVSSAYATIGLMGPKARDVLQKITPDNVSNDAMPFGSFRKIELGFAEVFALRISYVGELGWELYIPTDFARHVFDTILEAGAPFDLKLAGMHAMDSCRMEKAFRHFGHDITDEDHIVNAGLSFTCDFDKSIPFIGRDAVLARKDEGIPSKRLVQFKLNDPEPLLYHAEPILMNGDIVGEITSGAYGHHLGAAMGMGYVSLNEPAKKALIEDSQFEIEVACERFPAQASLSPFYDPKGERMRS